MDCQNRITEGENVILKKGNSLKVYRVLKKEKVFLEKRHFSLGPIIGHPYGSTWELQNGGLVQVLEKTESQDLAGQIEKGGTDNRAILDNDASQKLDKEDIMDLKEQGKSGQEIIEHLVENSATFNEKTVYSKAKYLKKKRNKHIMRFVVLRPCTRLLCEMYFNRAPSKNVQIRVDTMAQLLTGSNVQSGSKVMVMEHCQGLLVGAIMERLGGNGTVVHFHSEEHPMHTALQAFNFTRESKDTVLRTFKLKEVYDTLVLKKQPETIAIESNNDAKDSSTEKKEETSTEECIVREETVAMETDPSKNSTPEAGATESMEVVSSVTKETSGVETTDAEVRITGTGEGLPMATDATAEEKEEKPSNKVLDTTDNEQKRKCPDADFEMRREKKRQKLDKLAKTREMLLEKNMDSLLIATKFHPAPVLLALIDHLALSRPFVVFSPYKEALIECYVKLRERGGVINLNVTETWHREYQVLPERTHPLVTMNNAGGYILSGLHVGKA